MAKEQRERSKNIRVRRRNGTNLEVRPRIYLRMYANVPNLARVNPRNANHTALQRNEDSYNQRQSLAAAEASRSYKSEAEKRKDHNSNYIGHWPREKREKHRNAVIYAQDKSVSYEVESQKHRDVHRLKSFWDLWLTLTVS